MKNNTKFLFNKEMQDFIDNVERVFNAVAKKEGTEGTMLDWIDGNIEALEIQGILNGLTDREKFLFSFSALSTALQERLS